MLAGFIFPFPPSGSRKKCFCQRDEIRNQCLISSPDTSLPLKMQKNRKIKFCLKYDFSYDLFLQEKGKFIFPSLIFWIRIRDPDPG
jgi:hypothetical protein